MSVLGTQEVVDREHQDAGLGLGLGAQGHVNGHLITVEVGVEGGAAQRVQLQGLALHQHRLKGLDAQTEKALSAAIRSIRAGLTIPQNTTLQFMPGTLECRKVLPVLWMCWQVPRLRKR